MPGTGPGCSVACRWWDGSGRARTGTNPTMRHRGLAAMPRPPRTPPRRHPSRRGRRPVRRPPRLRSRMPHPRPRPLRLRPRPRRPRRCSSTAPEPEPLRELSVELTGGSRRSDAAAVPAAPSRSRRMPTRRPRSSRRPRSPTPSPAMPDLEPQERARPRRPRSRRVCRPRRRRSATPGALPEAAPALSPVTSRGPALPSPTIGAADQPATGSWTPTVTSSPGPVWPIAFGRPRSWAPARAGHDVAAGELRRRVAAKGRAAGSARCTSSARSRSTSRRCSHRRSIRPSSRAPRASPCEGTCGTCKVKKPCFLKTWLHHKSGCKVKGCKGCKPCSYCGEPPSYVHPLRASSLSQPSGDASAQPGPNRAMSRRGGRSSMASRPIASTNRRSVSSRCSATSGCSATTSFWSQRSSGLR